MNIRFVTSNTVKFEDAARYFSVSGIELKQAELAVPEIQADSADEICRAKADYVSERLSGPFFVEDSSFHIPSLNDFPGVYARYVVATLGTEGLLKLMNGMTSRECYFRSCVVFRDKKNTFHEFSFVRDGLFITDQAQNNITGWSELWRIIGIVKLNMHFSGLSPEQRSIMESGWLKENAFTRLIEHIRGEHSEKKHL